MLETYLELTNSIFAILMLISLHRVTVRTNEHSPSWSLMVFDKTYLLRDRIDVVSKRDEDTVI